VASALKALVAFGDGGNVAMNERALSSHLLEITSSKRMLAHPFYQAWEQGQLSLETLKEYAGQYYHHVRAFPRYISATHSLCDSLESRQVLLDNLIDEERGDQHHPGKWRNFATGLGWSAEHVERAAAEAHTQQLVDTFMSVARTSYAAGIAALFVYEQQIPAVARTKAEGLRTFYGINDDQTLDYFTLHAEVDVVHSEATRALVDALPTAAAAEATRGATAAADALWSFLDGMYSVHVAQLPPAPAPQVRSSRPEGCWSSAGSSN
jgi:pyrroloquinoline-quinone synthase